MAETPARNPGAARRRILWSLVAGVGLSSTGYILAVTVATIVATDLAGTAAFAGIPGAAIVMGSALGSALLSALMARRGRRPGLVAGYLIGAVGAGIALVAVVGRSFPLLIAAPLLMGFANSSSQLSRYTAADMFPLDRRATAIGTVVWGATVGAIVGPNLVTVAGDAAVSIGLPALSGPYLFLLAFAVVAAAVSFVTLRPDPYDLADDSSRRGPRGESPPTSIRELLLRPTVIAALTALIVGQVVMVVIMAMTPLHMAGHGHSLAEIGLVISGHTFGMFALSPISGRLTDRFGSVSVIFLGLATLAVSASMAALAPPDGGVVLFVALFLLGYGWNLGFVAGSTLLASGLEIHERTRLEGVTDALIWSSAAMATLTSGVVMSAAGYTALGLLGLALILLSALLLASRRSAVRAAAPGP
jgi:MFS family permease